MDEVLKLAIKIICSKLSEGIAIKKLYENLSNSFTSFSFT